jgi:glycerophosphoryl diester phosphodiesterase
MAHAEIIAHRGASGSAPENTLPAFELAVRHAGCIEHDLQVTRDGALVCLHDRSLQRTTNIRDVFPGRRWLVHDLTLAEIRTLDAGSWFAPAFTGTQIPTFDELLEWSRHRIAVLTEIKDVEAYEPLGVDPLGLVDRALRRHGRRAGSTDGVTVQSFHEPTVRRASALLGPHVPVALLVEHTDAERLDGRARLDDVARFAAGIGPEKRLIAANPGLVRHAHDAGLRVTPWTFRAAGGVPLAAVGADMRRYLGQFGVDAVITDHPEAFAM